jgi:hypothetical protein
MSEKNKLKEGCSTYSVVVERILNGVVFKTEIPAKWACVG